MSDENKETTPALPVIVKDERQGWTSASNAAADARCEGRHNAQKATPVSVSSDDAAFGQAIHDALAKQDPTGLDTEQHSIYDSMNEITEKLMKKVFGDDHTKATVVREQRYWCKVLAVHGDKTPKPLRYHHSGKLDFVARLGGRGLIIEYKSLPGDIEDSPTNDQLRDQVVIAAGNLILTEVYTAIVQPLVTHNPDLTLYNSDSIKKAEQEMFVRVRASNNPNAKRTPNKVSCKFCTAVNNCAEYQAWAAITVPDSLPVTGIPLAQWTPQQRAYFMTMRPVAKKWLEDCYAELKRMAKEKADSVPGYTLKEGAVQKPINDPEELYNRFRAATVDFFHTEAGPEADPMDVENLITKAFLSCVEVSKSDLEAIIRKATGLKGKGLNAKMEELTSGITDEKQNESSLVRAK